MAFLPPSWEILTAVWLSSAIVLLGLWWVQYRYQNAGIADFGYCVTFGVVTMVYAFVLPGDPMRKGLLGAMGAVYGFRLAWHLVVHRLYRKSEDARYQTLRKRMGKWAQVGFFLYFQGQAIAIVVFSLPLLVLMLNPSPQFSLWEILGFMLWILGVLGEALADNQLSQFRENPDNFGQTCRSGLWRYSRHPNYFFEGLIWCSYVVMAMGLPYGWLTLIGPVLMIGTLLKVSGIPFTEAQALATRGDDYREYQRTTSAFIPWFPKKS